VDALPQKKILQAGRVVGSSPQELGLVKEKKRRKELRDLLLRPGDGLLAGGGGADFPGPRGRNRTRPKVEAFAEAQKALHSWVLGSGSKKEVTTGGGKKRT